MVKYKTKTDVRKRHWANWSTTDFQFRRTQVLHLGFRNVYKAKGKKRNFHSCNWRHCIILLWYVCPFQISVMFFITAIQNRIQTHMLPFFSLLLSSIIYATDSSSITYCRLVMTGRLNLIFNYDYLKQGSSSKEESWQSTSDSWFKSPNTLHLQFSLCVKRDRLFLSWQKVVNA